MEKNGNRMLAIHFERSEIQIRISSFKSIEYLIGEGFKVVRIGSEAEKRIPIESDQFWDYAMDDHDEFKGPFFNVGF